MSQEPFAPKVVFVTGASVGFGAATVRLRQECGDLVLPIELDVRNRTAVEAVVASLPADYAEIDVLVNNAGLALGLEPAQEALMDDWEAMVDTNIKGLMYCTRAILPGMVARNRGHVINLGADLVGTAVRVTDVAPGLTGGTEFSEVRFHGDKAKADAVYKGTTPLNADDVADAIHWVATRPAHVNINIVQMMPVVQAFGPFAVKRT
jgi:3-hydroxy acid dehydrogenase/malonic semialdehyde reductase